MFARFFVTAVFTDVIETQENLIRAVAGQRSSPDLCFATTSVKIYDP